MSAAVVVEDLHVFKNIGLGLHAGLVVPLID